MSVIVEVKVCAQCLDAANAERKNSEPESSTPQEISEGFRLWEDYEFTPGECSYVDFLNATTCGICHGSLTFDRRRERDESWGFDRRVSMVADRRSPFGRGSRVLLASLRGA